MKSERNRPVLQRSSDKLTPPTNGALAKNYSMRRASGASSPLNGMASGPFGQPQIRPGLGAAGLEGGSSALDPEMGSSPYSIGGKDTNSMKKAWYLLYCRCFDIRCCARACSNDGAVGDWVC